MAGLDLQAARAALAASRIEGMDAPLGEWTEVAAIERRRDTVVVSIAVAIPAAGRREALAAEVRRVLAPRADGATIRVDCETRVVAAPRRTQSPGLESVRNVIAVASGKGGVGKSTTAVNLALALAHEGARVGLLDADVYGPSQQIMLGIPEHQRPEGRDERFLVPIEAYGLQTMSMGYLVTEKTAMVWRGPMASSALQQMLTQTLWRNLDYLVVDMPPGTGDIQLTLAQKVPVSGAVIVTTPQDIALLDCRKGIEMFTKVDIPVLGVVENMSGTLSRLRPCRAPVRHRRWRAHGTRIRGVPLLVQAAARHRDPCAGGRRQADRWWQIRTDRTARRSISTVRAADGAPLHRRVSSVRAARISR
jgi:ATP-binding protein involved in chromosome partitioning